MLGARAALQWHSCGHLRLCLSVFHIAVSVSAPSLDSADEAYVRRQHWFTVWPGLD